MGSFLELALDVDVRPDAPDPIVAAWSSARSTTIGPDLPEPHPVVPGRAVPAAHDDVDDPWCRDWAPLLGTGPSGVAFPGPTHCTLAWDPMRNLWHLSSRAVWELGPHETASAIAWMGPFLCPSGSPRSLVAVGTMHFEHANAPSWIHHDGRRFLFAGLGPAGYT